jgi:hypothetical protein
MRRRRGRPRKAGLRHKSGDLRHVVETPAAIAAAMPHRRGLGEQAVDQRAETELGRLVLRSTVDASLALAGETYLSLWRGYVFSLGGPQQLARGDGHGFTCDGCETAERRKWCRCEFRRRIFLEARGILDDATRYAVEAVVLFDWRPADEERLRALRAGLELLAVHFGLQPRKKLVLGNAASKSAPPQKSVPAK